MCRRLFVFIQNMRQSGPYKSLAPLFLMLSFGMGALAQNSVVDPQQAQARIRYAALAGTLTVQVVSPVTLHSDNRMVELPAGCWTFTAEKIHSAPKRYHVFPKTFPPHENQALNEYVMQWEQRGYHPTTIVYGNLFKTASGKTMDNRVNWVSLARFNTEAEAQTLIHKLKEESVWAWMRVEKTGEGKAQLRISDKQEQSPGILAAPLQLSCDKPIEILDVSNSFWKERTGTLKVYGPLKIAIGMEEKIEVYGQLSVEEYLRGVIPAEMPANWPMEALKAQALVARSEIYAGLAGKYRLEEFDFTTLESCRAYWGLEGYHAHTDAAIAATAGQAIVRDGKFVATVFSSCCGGWTENNEIVWSGPPNSALRGIADFPAGKQPAANNWAARISGKPNAWCAGAPDIFRWQKRYTWSELTDLVNKRYKVGRIRRIEEGPRGIGGRLKSVTIVGENDTVTIDRELAIRQVFGGLPSAMVIIKATPENGAPTAFLFQGGGRGHGVGLCQYGARAMADAGYGFDAIVKHYFSGVAIERSP